LIAERDRLNKDLESTHAAIKNLEQELEQMQGSAVRSHGRRWTRLVVMGSSKVQGLSHIVWMAMQDSGSPGFSSFAAEESTFPMVYRERKAIEASYCYEIPH